MSSITPSHVVLCGVLAAILVPLAGCGPDRPAGPGVPVAVGTAGASAGPSASPPAGAGPAAGAPAPDRVAAGHTAAPATTAARGVPPKPVAPLTSFPGTARAYAEATVAAWSTGNLVGLAQLSTPEVYEQFLEVPGKLNPDWIYYRCDGAAGSSYCTLRNGVGDSVTLRVTNQYLGGAHAVVALSASLTTYPAGGEAYASEFVRAWAAGNTPRMRALARPDVVVAVNDNHQDRPQGTWTLATVSEHGGAGLLIVEVDVNEGGIRFTLDVGSTLLGTPHAIVGYRPPA
jgi:hypothetical protein